MRKLLFVGKRAMVVSLAVVFLSLLVHPSFGHTCRPHSLHFEGRLGHIQEIPSQLVHISGCRNPEVTAWPAWLLTRVCSGCDCCDSYVEVSLDPNAPFTANPPGDAHGGRIQIRSGEKTVTVHVSVVLRP